MDKIASGTQESRSRLFTQTGEKIGIDTHLAEKDILGMLRDLEVKINSITQDTA
ncbi:MAG: hypothetical protein WCS96_15140 [Victivallales bacterium]